MSLRRLSRPLIPSTINWGCSTVIRRLLRPLRPLNGPVQQTPGIYFYIYLFKDFIFKCIHKNRYPNGNSVAGAVGLTTGVGAGSPPYTPLPGAASPDQTTTTPLCHPISSNEGSYNLHHKSKGNTFFFFFYHRYSPVAETFDPYRNKILFKSSNVIWDFEKLRRFFF